MRASAPPQFRSHPFRAPASLLVAALTVAMCEPALGALEPAQAPQPAASAAPGGGRMVIFQGGLKNGWQDWGWAHRQIEPNHPAQLNFTKYAG